MELNQKIDATIISKISDRKDISKLKSIDIFLKASFLVGSVAKQIEKKQSPVAYLTPLYLQATLLARKANVNIGMILDGEEYAQSETEYSDQKIASAQLSISFYNLNCSACDFEEISKDTDKQELKDIQLQGVVAAFNIMKNIEVIAKSNKYSLEQVQQNVLKHLDQLIKLI